MFCTDAAAAGAGAGAQAAKVTERTSIEHAIKDRFSITDSRVGVRRDSSASRVQVTRIARHVSKPHMKIEAHEQIMKVWLWWRGFAGLADRCASEKTKAPCHESRTNRSRFLAHAPISRPPQAAAR